MFAESAKVFLLFYSLTILRLLLKAFGKGNTT
jgi:hypothetical protein